MTLADRWHRYWFRPAPLLDLAVVRIAVVGFTLISIVFPYALLEFPPYDMFDIHVALPDDEYHPPWILRLLTLPFGRPTVEHLFAVYWISVTAGLFALLGCFTRPACLLLALGNAYMSSHAYAYDEHHHVEALGSMLLFLLAMSPSGSRLSFDAWSRRRPAGENAPPPPALHPEAGWPLLLMRWLFSMSYLSAVFCKLGGGGLDWLNGYTVRYYLLQDAVYWNLPLGIWMAEHHWMGLALTWFTLVVEGLFFLVLIWPRLALLFVPAAAAMHVGIYFTMRAPFWLYLPLYAVFVPWSALLRRWRGSDD